LYWAKIRKKRPTPMRSSARARELESCMGG
jgi:hypothetical protein